MKDIKFLKPTIDGDIYFTGHDIDLVNGDINLLEGTDRVKQALTKLLLTPIGGKLSPNYGVNLKELLQNVVANPTFSEDIKNEIVYAVTYLTEADLTEEVVGEVIQSIDAIDILIQQNIAYVVLTVTLESGETITLTIGG